MSIRQTFFKLRKINSNGTITFRKVTKQVLNNCIGIFILVHNNDKEKAEKLISLKQI